MAILSSMFAIDVCSYTIMPNRYHLVLKVDARRAQAWSVDAVIKHWTILFAGPDLIKRFRSGQFLSPADRDKVTDIVEA